MTLKPVDKYNEAYIAKGNIWLNSKMLKLKKDMSEFFFTQASSYEENFKSLH